MLEGAVYDPDLPYDPSSIVASYALPRAHLALVATGPGGDVSVRNFAIDRDSTDPNDGSAARTDGMAGDRVFEVPALTPDGATPGAYKIELVTTTQITDDQFQPSFSARAFFSPPTVGFGAGDIFAAQGTGRTAGAIFNDDVLSEHAREAVGENARHHIGRTAGRKRHDEANDARRISLG